MMETIRQYLLSIICACVMVTIVKAFIGDKAPSAGIIKLIAGAFLIFTVVAPVVRMQFEDLQDYYIGVSEDAQKVVGQGEAMSQQACQAIIKEQLETYILDKADSLGLDLEIDISFPDISEMSPDEIMILGNASPYGRKTLQTFLTEEIGIPEDKQIWR